VIGYDTGRLRKEEEMGSGYCPHVCMERQKKITKTIWIAGTSRDSNQNLRNTISLNTVLCNLMSYNNALFIFIGF
jgi:hypothetical protein